MSSRSRLVPEAFDPVNCSDADLVALHLFNGRVGKELDPNDRVPSVETTIRNHRSIAALSDIDVYMWVIRAGSKIVAHASAEIVNRPDNPHAMQLSPIRVLPDYRRRGLATALLAEIFYLAIEHEKKLLLNTTDSRVPAGEAFAEAIGAEPGLEGQVSELDLERTGLAEVAGIELAARQQAAGYEVGLWTGRYPDSELTGVAAVKRAMNDVPSNGLDVDLTERVATPEQLRDQEAYLFGAGRVRWTLFGRHERSGELAGFTEISWDDEQPGIVMQGETGVLPEHRGHGLGLWMKAAMVRRVLQGATGAKRIRTTNADLNEPMLRINQRLGFRPTWTDREWQARIDRVQKYLHRRQQR